MSRPRTIEGRIEQYRITHTPSDDLDRLLVDAEAEIYRLRRAVRVLEQRLERFRTE